MTDKRKMRRLPVSECYKEYNDEETFLCFTVCDCEGKKPD